MLPTSILSPQAARICCADQAASRQVAEAFSPCAHWCSPKSPRAQAAGHGLPERALGTQWGMPARARQQRLPVASDRVVAHLGGALSAPAPATLLQILLVVLLLQRLGTR